MVRMKTIAIVNQKGGVGKTTTAINLSSSLAALGKKILLIDLDPQANSTKGLGVNEVNKTIYNCLINKTPASDCIYHTNIKNLDIIPSSDVLSNAEQEMTAEIGRETILKDNFDITGYHYVIIDCNPSLGLLTVNALTLVKNIIITMEAGIFAFEGIERLVKTIALVKRKLNPSLDIYGVLLTRVDGRTNLSREFRNELMNIFGEKSFKTVIHQNVTINEAQSEQIPVNHYDSKCIGAIEYKKLAREILTKDKLIKNIKNIRKDDI